MPAAMMKVGQLARKTGLTVRTLHYYEEIGLLRPGQRTAAGYRLYGADDVARLQQILSLRQLGFALDDIRTCLEQPTFSPGAVIRLHLGRLREQIELQQQLCQRLEAIATHLDTAEEVSVDLFLQTIERMTMIEQYYTPEQLEELRQRREALGEAGMQQAQDDWAALYAEARAEMARGTDPLAEPVLRLARRAQALIEAFTGGNPAIRASLDRMYREQGPEQASQGMVDAEVMAYMGPAMAKVMGK